MAPAWSGPMTIGIAASAYCWWGWPVRRGCHRAHVRRRVSEGDFNPYDRDLRLCIPHRIAGGIVTGQKLAEVSEVRRAPYVHDQHNPDHGVRSAFSRCVVTTADEVIRTTTMGGGRRRRLGVRRRCEAASYAIAQPRPIASSAVAASREGTHDQVLVRSRQANGSAPRAEQGGTKTRPCRRSWQSRMFR